MLLCNLIVYLRYVYDMNLIDGNIVIKWYMILMLNINIFICI